MSEIMSGYTRNAFGQPVGLEVMSWASPEALETDRIAGRFCCLETLQAECHGPDLWHAWQQPEPAIAEDRGGRSRWTYLGGRPFDDLAGCQDWLTGMSEAPGLVCFAVVDSREGRALGMAAYLNDVPAEGRVEIGHVSFSTGMARSRISSEALMLMMAEAFGKGYRRLEWKCDALNVASRRAAERLGYRFEGIFRQHRVVAGRNRDTAWYSLLDGEWPAIHAAHRRWLSADNFDDQGAQRQSLASMMQQYRAEA